MDKRFIILIDFSEGSSNLIKYACHWNQQIDAALVLVHKMTVSMSPMTPNENKMEIIKQTHSKALNNIKELTKDIIPENTKVSYVVSEKDLTHILKELLDEDFDNLILVGLKHKKTVEKIVLGSTVVHLIDNIKNNIVAKPKDLDVSCKEKIFVAVSDKFPLNILALNNFLNFIKQDNTSITFFHISNHNGKEKEVTRILQELSDLFSARYKTDYRIYKSKKSVEDIKKIVNNVDNEILVVQRGTRFFTDKLFRKFLVNELIYEGNTPMMVLPEVEVPN